MVDMGFLFERHNDTNHDLIDHLGEGLDESRFGVREGHILPKKKGSQKSVR